MSIVLDSSLALSWYFEDERTPEADAVLDRIVEEGATVPTLWRLEVANGLQMAMRRKRITISFRDTAIAHLSRLPIAIDSETDARAWGSLLQLSDRFRLTVYDAAYLELAQRRSLPLATLDRDLRAAARAAGAALIGAA